jgi:hydroxypyruvate reductase
MNYRNIAEDIFLSGVRRVLPDSLISKVISIEGRSLIIGDNVFPISNFEHIWLIGAGKASALMAAEAENILGEEDGGHGGWSPCA